MKNEILLIGAAKEDTATVVVGTLLYGYNTHQVSASVRDRFQ